MKTKFVKKIHKSIASSPQRILIDKATGKGMDHGVNFRSSAFPIPVVQRFPFSAFNQHKQKRQQKQQKQHKQKQQQQQPEDKKSPVLQSYSLTGFIRKPAKAYIHFYKVDALVDPNCNKCAKIFSEKSPSLLSPVQSLKMRARSSEARRAGNGKKVRLQLSDSQLPPPPPPPD